MSDRTPLSCASERGRKKKGRSSRASAFTPTTITAVSALGRVLDVQHLSPTASLPLPLSARRSWSDGTPFPPPRSPASEPKHLSISVDNRKMEQLLPERLPEERLVKAKRGPRRGSRKIPEERLGKVKRGPRRGSNEMKGNSQKRMTIIEKINLSFNSLQPEKLSSEIKPANAVQEGEGVKYVEPRIRCGKPRKKMKWNKYNASKNKDLLVITNAEGSCVEENVGVVSDKINGREINDETSKAAAFALLMISNSRAKDESFLESPAQTSGLKKKKKMKAPEKNGSSSVINAECSCLDKNAEAGLDKNNEKKVDDRASKTNLQKTDRPYLEPAVKSTGSKKKRKKNASKKTNSSPIISADGSCLDKNAEITLGKIDEKKTNGRPFRTDLQATEGTFVEASKDYTDSKKKNMKIESEKQGPSPLNNAEGSCLGKNEEVTSERINEDKSGDEGFGIDKQSIDRICLGYTVDSTDSKKKKNASEKKGPSADTNADGSCLAEVDSDKINENVINDRPSKIDQRMVYGTHLEFAVGTTERAKSRQSCDWEYADVTCVTTQIDDNVEIKCLSVGSSGKKPQISDASSANEVENRHSKQHQRMKQQTHDSKNNSVDDLPYQGQANQNGTSEEKSMESEILPRLNEVEYKYQRRGQKRKEHLPELENSSDFPKHELEFSVISDSMNEKLEPLESGSQKSKLKYEYLKCDHEQKQKDPGPQFQSNLVDVKLGVMEYSQVLRGRSKEESYKLAGRLNIDTAVTSEEPETYSHASPVTNVRNAAASIELPGKMDISSNVIKEEASGKTLLVVRDPTSQQCLDEESGLKFKEEITGVKLVNDGHKSFQADVTMKHSPVREAVATVSLMEECSSANIHLKSNSPALEKVSGQDNLLKVEKPLVHLRKKLLVLDLNGLLVDILYVSNVTHRAYKRIAGKSAFKRPFCDEFLDFCFEAFDIGIWSSRMRCNVDAAVDYIMGDRKHRLLFSWDQSKCTKTGYKTIENSHKPLVLKELKKLWNKEEQSLPWEEGAYSPSNTLLIDDSPYKALCNPPHTAIFPHPFNFENERDNSLGPAGDIRTYLEGLAKADNCQEYVKDHPFGQKFIAEDHPSWTFYLRVAERVKGLVKAATNR